MNELSNKETPEEQIYTAHEFLLDFINKFELAKRGGIHDFMELAIYNMINSTVNNIDSYLKEGHKSVMPQEIMSIFADSCQNVLDGIKRNLDGLERVNFR